MERGQEDPEQLRRRLYRRDASPADLASYLRATEEPDDAAAEHAAGGAAIAEAPERSPSLRPFAVGATCVGAAALIGGLLMTGAAGGPLVTPSPTPAVATQDGGWTIRFTTATVLDGGPTVHASGTAVAEGSDAVRYVVAPHDRADAIAARFGICEGDVQVALPYGMSETSIPAGAVLELRSATSC